MTTVGSLLVKLGLDAAQYQKGIGESQRAAERMAKGIEGKLGGISGKFSALGNSITSRLLPVLGPKLAGAAGAAVAGIGSVIAIIGTLTAAAAVAAVAVGGLVAGITAGAFALAKAAVPTDGIRRAFEGLTSTIKGGSSQMLSALQEATAGMVSSTDIMRSFNLAAQLVGVQFAERLPDAMQYLGKVSLATGADMNWLLDSLARGVGRLSPMILDNLGVTINLTQAYQDWATANNRTTESMSKVEQQAAVMDQVVTKLQENTANMPSIVGTAAQVWASLGVSLRGIKTQMGTDLLPTFTSLLATLHRFVPALQAFASGFTGTFVGVANVARSFIVGLARGMGIDFDQLANNSGTWGENIVLQLAAGMARAIGAVIQVLNQLGQVIASWLAPGSPPKILPHIDDWGKQTAQEWINGFTAADVSTLRNLSGMVENFLRSLPTEALGGANIAETILNFRDAIANALSTGGNVISTLPQQVQAYAAAFIAAQQAAEGVTAATENLSAAQDVLNATQQRYSAILDPLRAQLEGITAAQQKDARSDRRGVLQAIIAEAKANGDLEAEKRALRELEQLAIQDQIAMIEAQESAAVDAAQSEVDAAQDALNAAQEEQRQAEQRLQMEQELIQHQMETNRLLQEMVGGLEGAAGGAASAAGGIASLAESLSSGLGGVLPAIGSGISNLAQQIIDAFIPVEGAAVKLGITWGGVLGSIMGKAEEWKNSWNSNVKNVQNVIYGFEAMIGVKFKEAEGNIIGFVTSIVTQFETWKGSISGALSIVADQLNKLKTTAEIVAGGIIGAMAGMSTTMPGVLVGALGAINGLLGVVDGLLTAFQNLANFLQNTIFTFKIELPEIPDWATPGSPIPLHTAWKDFSRFLDGTTFRPDMAFADAMMPSLANGLAPAGMGSGSDSDGPLIGKLADTINIGSEEDMNLFAAKVEQVILRARRRG